MVEMVTFLEKYLNHLNHHQVQKSPMNPRHQAQGVPVGLQLGHPPCASSASLLRKRQMVHGKAGRRFQVPPPGVEIHGKIMGNSWEIHGKRDLSMEKWRNLVT